MILEVHKKQLDLLQLEGKIKDATLRKIELETALKKEMHSHLLNTVEDFRLAATSLFDILEKMKSV